MQAWHQIYTPLGSLGLSAFVATIPIIFFFVALAALRSSHVAAAITLLLSLGVAILAYGMPVPQALAAAGFGFAYGIWPIAWIIVAAVFLYKIVVKTGQFDIIRASVLSITDDQRLQMLLIGFSFGAFLEGAAGFGAPVAITAALLVGLGFKPLRGRTVPDCKHGTGRVRRDGHSDHRRRAGDGHRPVPYRRDGRPPVAAAVARGAVLARVHDGRTARRAAGLAAALVAGGSFAVTQYFTSNHIRLSCRTSRRRSSASSHSPRS